MKKTLILFGILSVFQTVCYAYQQQGFSEYKENIGSTNFVCQGQCIILIGPTIKHDFINIDGIANGNGVIGYGILLNQEITAGNMTQINGNQKIKEKFILSRSFNKIPLNSQTVIIMQGNINGDINIKPDNLGLVQKIKIGWNDFREMETLTPYSINLRYGIKILGVSILKYAYWIFIILTLFILIFIKGTKENKYQKIFFLGIGIFIFIGIRNLITYSQITNQGLKNYSNQSEDNKIFFDLGDYIIFTNKIRKELNLDSNISETSCKIQINSFQDRPFKAHWESVYLKPCTFVEKSDLADYIIYYKKSISLQDQQKPILLEFNGSYLLQNK